MRQHQRQFPVPVTAEGPAVARVPQARSDAVGEGARPPVVLVGFIRRGNLGIGYLAATLARSGYRVITVDIEDPMPQGLASIKKAKPILVGFSLIFQFYIPLYAQWIQALRQMGVTAHFTVGGHFPSLSSKAALQYLPGLDSVVRFEGEVTLLELCDGLSEGRNWQDVNGIALTNSTGGYQENPNRHLVHDLDDLPWPQRSPPSSYVLGLPILQMLASRGCARTCSFCSIQTFYRAAPGKVVRTRVPAKVVQEMRALYDQYGTCVFLFQDDDFPVVGKVWRRWANELVDALEAADLVGRVIWKISCRADAVEPQLFERMHKAGLYLVYMGLESGNEEGLSVLNKEVDVEQNLKAVQLLQDLGIAASFGFMMFDPSSTFASIRDNAKFLSLVTGRHENAASFCRMVPYDGTTIKDALVREGRLTGDVCNPNYDFLDPRLDALYTELMQLTHLSGWEHGQRAVTPMINSAWHEVAVMKRLGIGLEGLPHYTKSLKALTRQSNSLLLQVVTQVTDYHEHGIPHGWNSAQLQRKTDALAKRLIALRNAFVNRNEMPLLALTKKSQKTKKTHPASPRRQVAGAA